MIGSLSAESLTVDDRSWNCLLTVALGISPVTSRIVFVDNRASLWEVLLMYWFWADSHCLFGV